jgi:hypothetical protein
VRMLARTVAGHAPAGGSQVGGGQGRVLARPRAWLARVLVNLSCEARRRDAAHVRRERVVAALEPSDSRFGLAGTSRSQAKARGGGHRHSTVSTIGLLYAPPAGARDERVSACKATVLPMRAGSLRGGSVTMAGPPPVVTTGVRR